MEKNPPPQTGEKVAKRTPHKKASHRKRKQLQKCTHIAKQISPPPPCGQSAGTHKLKMNTGSFSLAYVTTRSYDRSGSYCGSECDEI